MKSISVYSEVVEIPYCDPYAAFLRLREAWGEQEVFLLESLSGPERDTASSVIGFGRLLTAELSGATVRLTASKTLLPAISANLAAAGFEMSEPGQIELRNENEIWPLLRTVQGTFTVPARGPGPFRFGFFGYFGYDIARAIERLPSLISDATGLPVMTLSIFHSIAEFDLPGQRCSLVVNRAAEWPALPIEELRRSLPEDAKVQAVRPPDAPRPRRVRQTMGRAAYVDRVERALEYIRAGDIFQVQIGHQLEIETGISPLQVYQRLRHRNPSPYMYFAPFGEVALIGASPESFVRVEDGWLTMRPIAGTIARGATAQEDNELVERLSRDDKELAEHVMLVDLCRNDIGRVCEPGTLEANGLFVVERYSHVNHLVSTVKGRLRQRVDSYDVIAATFPAGTMTGAPKVRAMEIIEELELTRRGPYAGAVGLIDFNGYVNMALCIRSVVHRAGTYLLRASAGTVADSTPLREWQETLHKLGATYWSVTGQELRDENLDH